MLLLVVFFLYKPKITNSPVGVYKQAFTKTVIHFQAGSLLFEIVGSHSCFVERIEEV